MKRLLSLLLAAMLLAGCNNTTSPSDKTDEPQTLAFETEERESTDVGNADASALAADSGNFQVTKGMMTYFFHGSYQEYYDEAASYGLDMTLPLKEQECPYDEGMTWFDYLMDETRVYVAELLGLCEAAKAEGIALNEDERGAVGLQVSEMMAQLEVGEGENFDDVLSATFGSAITEGDVRGALEMMTLAAKYAVDFDKRNPYTDEELDAYYEENSRLFDMVDVIAFTVTLGDFGYTEGEEGESTETSVPAVGLEEAQAAMDDWTARLRGAENGDAFLRELMTYLTEVRGYTERETEDAVRYCAYKGVYADDHLLSGDGNTWAFTAKTGDSMTVDYESGIREIYYLTEEPYRNEAHTANVRHILFSYDMYETAEEAQAAANEAWAEWESKGFTTEAYAELCARLSHDSTTAAEGGLNENVIPGSTPGAFDEWVFDPARQAGDRTIIQTSYGHHILYHEGEAARTVWQVKANEYMLSEAYNNIIDTNAVLARFYDDVIDSIEA